MSKRAICPALAYVPVVKFKARNPLLAIPQTLAAIYQTAQTINRLDRLKNLKLQQIHFKPDKTFTIEHYLEGRTKRIFKPLLT